METAFKTRPCGTLAITACVLAVACSHRLADTVKGGELSYMALALARDKGNDRAAECSLRRLSHYSDATAQFVTLSAERLLSLSAEWLLSLSIIRRLNGGVYTAR